MKNILIICFAVQIVLATIAVAQITFTREWVTGKRSLPPTRKVVLKEEHAWCSRSFVPVIEYLMEEERVRKHECGSHLSVNIPKSASWIRPAILDELPKTITMGNDDHLQYEVFSPKSS